MVDWNLIIAAGLTSFFVAMTPGPNNIICAAIGARYGYRRAIPYALGVIVGFPLMLGGVGLGLGTAIRLYPQIQQTVQVLGTAFLFYLAYRIATAPFSNIEQQQQEVKNILGFWYALLFQWINPKALSFAFSLIALYTRPQTIVLDTLSLMAVSVLMSMVSTTTWALIGSFVGRFLHTARRQRIFNITMAILLALAAVSIII